MNPSTSRQMDFDDDNLAGEKRFQYRSRVMHDFFFLRICNFETGTILFFYRNFPAKGKKAYFKTKGLRSSFHKLNTYVHETRETEENKTNSSVELRHGTEHKHTN